MALNGSRATADHESTRTWPALHLDCRQFRGAAPCAPHKAHGYTCDSCPVYDPVGEQILIIKLGAMGDVLRTTALLPDVVRAHDRPVITWIVNADSLPLLRGNALIDRAVATDAAVPLLMTREFDAVYTLDAAAEAVALSVLAKAPRRRGYRPGPRGSIVGVEDGGDETLFQIGLWDRAKRENDRSYLEMLAASAGLTYSGGLATIPRDAATEQTVARELAGLARPLIGLNAFASKRWQHKSWLPEHAAAFAGLLNDAGYGVLLLGAGDDERQNVQLSQRFGGDVSTFHSSERPDRLIAALSHIDLLVTSDSLAMHVAWGLQTPIVALFGPTSAREIDLAPEDAKLTPELNCLSCYLASCDIQEHCMKLLTPELVFQAVRSRLEAAPRSASYAP